MWKTSLSFHRGEGVIHFPGVPVAGMSFLKNSGRFVDTAMPQLQQ